MSIHDSGDLFWAGAVIGGMFVGFIIIIFSSNMTVSNYDAAKVCATAYELMDDDFRADWLLGDGEICVEFLKHD